MKTLRVSWPGARVTELSSRAMLAVPISVLSLALCLVHWTPGFSRFVVCICVIRTCCAYRVMLCSCHLYAGAVHGCSCHAPARRVAAIRLVSIIYSAGFCLTRARAAWPPFLHSMVVVGCAPLWKGCVRDAQTVSLVTVSTLPTCRSLAAWWVVS